MAMVCVNGCKECDGCGECFEGNINLRCPECMAILSPDERIFISKRHGILGCEHCLIEEYAEDVKECWEA